MYPIGNLILVKEGGCAVVSGDWVGCIPVQAEISNPAHRMIRNIRDVVINSFFISILVKNRFYLISEILGVSSNQHL
jgi:hypothetical protein